MTADPLTPFDVYVAALESGFMPLARFVAWADRRIAADPHQPGWVLDLALARDVEHAASNLRHEWVRQAEMLTAPPNAAPVRLHLGFLLGELLGRAGRHVDAYGGGDGVPDEDSLYLLLNEAGGGATRPSERPLADRVRDATIMDLARGRAFGGPPELIRRVEPVSAKVEVGDPRQRRRHEDEENERQGNEDAPDREARAPVDSRGA